MSPRLAPETTFATLQASLQASIFVPALEEPGMVTPYLCQAWLLCWAPDSNGASIYPRLNSHEHGASYAPLAQRLLSHKAVLEKSPVNSISKTCLKPALLTKSSVHGHPLLGSMTAGESDSSVFIRCQPGPSLLHVAGDLRELN